MVSRPDVVPFLKIISYKGVGFLERVECVPVSAALKLNISGSYDKGNATTHSILDCRLDSPRLSSPDLRETL
jgi:hypothetical protein